MICMVLYIYLAVAIFDHGLNVPLLLIHFWHGKISKDKHWLHGFIYPSHNGYDAIFICHDFPLSLSSSHVSWLDIEALMRT